MSTPSKPPAQSLQQRLEAIVDSERKAQELQDELREQRWAAQQHDGARRMEALVEALEAAKAEIAKREDAERKLARIRLEAGKIAVELGQAQRDADEALRTAKPRTAERLAQAEEALSVARAEAESERLRREELELELEATVKAERAARDETARVRAEAERVRSELEQSIEAFAAREAHTRQAHQRRLAEIESAQARESKRVPEQKRRRIFQERGRTCAVCRRTEANSPGGLKAGGWALGAEIDLCPDCQENGWQLPKGGSLPFRRSSKREEADA